MKFYAIKITKPLTGLSLCYIASQTSHVTTDKAVAERLCENMNHDFGQAFWDEDIPTYSVIEINLEDL